MWYFIEPIAGKYVKEHGFLSFVKNLSEKCTNELLDRELNSLTVASEKAIHKKGESLWDKISNAVAKSYDNKTEKTKPVTKENRRNLKKNSYWIKKGEEILNKLRQVLSKWNIIKYPNY